MVDKLHIDVADILTFSKNVSNYIMEFNLSCIIMSSIGVIKFFSLNSKKMRCYLSELFLVIFVCLTKTLIYLMTFKDLCKLQPQETLHPMFLMIIFQERKKVVSQNTF